MLAEGFLRVLRYRHERKFASRSQIDAHCQDLDLSIQDPADVAEAGPNQEALDPSHDPVGVQIPGCPPVLTPDPNVAVCLESCSLLEQYPDLQVADSGCITHRPPRTTIIQHSFSPQPVLIGAPHPPDAAPQQEASVSDQGYLVMGASVNVSLDVPHLEPMSNSLLNGMLEKQVEQVYLQHLTDNLARCNSQFGNSLLYGLLPPPKPGGQLQGPDSLDVSLEVESAASGKTISYLNTQNAAPCSSTFSSPMLRISGAEEPLQ